MPGALATMSLENCLGLAAAISAANQPPRPHPSTGMPSRPKSSRASRYQLAKSRMLRTQSTRAVLPYPGCVGKVTA